MVGRHEYSNTWLKMYKVQHGVVFRCTWTCQPLQDLVPLQLGKVVQRIHPLASRHPPLLQGLSHQFLDTQHNYYVTTTYANNVNISKKLHIKLVTTCLMYIYVCMYVHASINLFKYVLKHNSKRHHGGVKLTVQAAGTKFSNPQQVCRSEQLLGNFICTKVQKPTYIVAGVIFNPCY